MTMTTEQLVNTFRKSGVIGLSAIERISLLRAADEAYYNAREEVNGGVLLTDDEYDLLRAGMPMTHVGASPTAGTEVRLPYLMPSLDKIKPDRPGDLAAWMRRFPGPYVLMPKLDGVSALMCGDRFYTRGNGAVGTDITQLLPHFMRHPLPDGVAARGELIISRATFSQKYATTYANARNLVSGIINKGDPTDPRLTDIHFIVYEWFDGPTVPSRTIFDQHRVAAQTLASRTQSSTHVIMAWGAYATLSNEFLSQYLRSIRDTYSYDIDGLVIVPNDPGLRSMVDRDIAKSPDYMVAFKTILTDQLAEATVSEVVWSASKDGYLKPRVRFTPPVALAGVSIEWATGFNARYILDNRIGVGAVVEIVRSGDVIPHIHRVVRDAINVVLPENAQWTDTGVDLILTNKETSVEVAAKELHFFFHTGLEVDGFGMSTASKLAAAGYTTIDRVATMSKTDFMTIDGISDKMATKLREGIVARMHTASAVRWLAYSGVLGRGIGEKKVAAILAAYPDALATTTPIQTERIASIPGMSLISAAAFARGVAAFRTLLDRIGDTSLADRLLKPVVSSERQSAVSDHPLKGRSIVLTGFRDKALQDAIVSVGGIIGSTITRNTHCLLVKNDDQLTTVKAKNAAELGIPVMTADVFAGKYFSG